jgi:hypothetical protein
MFIDGEMACDQCGSTASPLASVDDEILCARCDGRRLGYDEALRDRQLEDLKVAVYELVGEYGPDRAQLQLLDLFDDGATEWRRRNKAGIPNGSGYMRQHAAAES